MTKEERKERGLRLVRAGGTANGADTAGAGDNNGADTGQQGHASEARQAACAALSNLLLRGDGWVRITPTENASQVWLVYKITRGKWAQHYTAVSVAFHDWYYGVEKLAERMDDIDLGLRRPAVDRPFGGHDA